MRASGEPPPEGPWSVLGRGRSGGFAAVALIAVFYGLVQVRDGVDGVPLARKPNVVDADAGNEPLYETF